jgi:hypothetical protein
MKRLFVVTLLVLVMSACTRTAEVTAPQAQAPVEKLLFELPLTEDAVNWQAEVIRNPEVTKADFRTANEPLLVKSVKIAETADVLRKTAACSETYGPFARYPNPFPGQPSTLDRWSFPQFATRWPNPPLATNIVIWYFGGIYPNSPNPQDFIAGEALLNGDLDCWTNADQVLVTLTGLKKRGIDAPNVNPELGVRAVINEFNTISLKFVFKRGDINLQRRHADVNIDIASVTVSTP